MLRIGLTQRVEPIGHYQETRDCLDQRWAALLSSMGCLPLPLPNMLNDVKDLVSGIPLDGVILTGGNDLSHLPGASNPAPERDTLERRLFDVCSASNLPVLGVCRGLHMMAVYYGSRLCSVTGHISTCHAVRVRTPGVLPLSDRDEVNSFHGYGVHASALGPELLAVAVADDGTVEAIAHKTLRQWAIMWHPERPRYDSRDVDLIRGLFAGRGA